MTRDDPHPIVLLTEDNALVGLDLRDVLEEAGYRVVGPFGRTSDALFWLAREQPDLALLDVMLDDGPSTTLAEALRREGVPFLVHSACDPDEALGHAFARAPWLDKPALSRDVVARLADLTSMEIAR